MTIRPALRLAERRHWVFDMDGTLTQAVHDFPAIKRALGIAEQEDILQHLAALPAWHTDPQRPAAGLADPAGYRPG